MAPKPKPAVSQPADKPAPAAAADFAPTVVVHATFAEALLAAQAALRPIPKDKRNENHGYSYTSAERMVQDCRNALHAHGLAAVRNSWTIVFRDPHVFLSSTFTLYWSGQQEPPAQYVMEWPVVQIKGSSFDKAVAIALTTSLNYWLRDLLLAPRDDETMDDRKSDVPAALPPLNPNPPDGLPNAKPVQPLKPATPQPEPKEDPDLSATPTGLRMKLESLMRDSGVTVDEVEKLAAMNNMISPGVPFHDFSDAVVSRFIDNWERVTTLIESKIRN